MRPTITQALTRRRAAHAAGLSLVAALALVASSALGGCAPFAGGGSGRPTTAPTATTPTPAIQGQLARAVHLNIWGLGVEHLDTVYDAQHTTAKVTITLGGTVPNTDLKASAAQALTKAFCLMAQQALWTSDVPLDEATVIVQGPEQDPYSGVIVEVYGEAVVEASTAQRIAWASVTADGAWQIYDREYLRTAFQDTD